MPRPSELHIFNFTAPAVKFVNFRDRAAALRVEFLPVRARR